MRRLRIYSVALVCLVGLLSGCTHVSPGVIGADHPTAGKDYRVIQKSGFGAALFGIKPETYVCVFQERSTRLLSCRPVIYNLP